MRISLLVVHCRQLVPQRMSVGRVLQGPTDKNDCVLYPSLISKYLAQFGARHCVIRVSQQESAKYSLGVSLVPRTQGCDGLLYCQR